ncbi:hypothetical protein U1Q18_008496 [Sarracenia purpurea var. burkii]
MVVGGGRTRGRSSQSSLVVGELEGRFVGGCPTRKKARRLVNYGFAERMRVMLWFYREDLISDAMVLSLIGGAIGF